MEKILDFMAKGLVTLDSKKTVAEAVKFMKEKKIGSVLVTEKDKISGIFTERDLISKVDYSQPEQMRSMQLKDVMTRGLKTVSANEHYINALQLMQKYNIRHMPVEKNGRIIGMVSLRDLINRYQENLERTLEEREGEIFKGTEKIRESEERFRTVFNNSAVGITVTDKDERIVSWNPFAAQLLGMTGDDLAGKLVKDLYPADEWKRIRSLNIRQQGMKNYFETKMLHKRGEQLDIGISISVLKDAGGNVIGSIGVMRNITEHKKLEKIRQEFAEVVSHEFRTPLTPIREGVSQILDGLLGSIAPAQKDALTIVLQEIDRLRRIIDDMLDTLKLEAGKAPMRKESVDMARLVNGIVQTFTSRVQAKGLKLKVSFSQDTLPAFADRDRMIQVFTNLVSNALKFTKKGAIEIAVMDMKDHIECSVTDTGRGITKADAAKLFSKFQQVGKKLSGEEAGTGLGLVICKDIIELHKGEIWVESKLNEGTTFRFTLPKYSAKELFQEYIVTALKDAVEDTVFSVATVRILNLAACRKELGEEKAASLVHMVENAVRMTVRQGRDVVIKDTDGVLVILPGTTKENETAVLDRAEQTLREYLIREQLVEACTVSWKGVNFPQDGRTIDELMQKITRA
jgi:PAS domain S-box-containing protein